MIFFLVISYVSGQLVFVCDLFLSFIVLLYCHLSKVDVIMEKYLGKLKKFLKFYFKFLSSLPC